MDNAIYLVVGVLVVALVLIPLIVSSFLRSVEAGTIRMVTRLGGTTSIYRGPGKSVEVPLLTTGTTLSSRAINVDLDITDQTADVDDQGIPRPIKVRVLASAIVSVGDSDTLIKTAANRFFSKPEAEQINILIDLLSSSGRRAINLLTHDQLFSAKTAPPKRAVMSLPNASSVINTPDGNPANAEVVVAPTTREAVQAAEDDDDPLAIIIRKACSKELTDLGLIFNSLNIKVVQSEVAEARRRQSAAEAQANADIVSAQQARRSKEAQLEAERSISNSQRELEQAKAGNAALVAEAEILKTQATEIAEARRRQASTEAQANADIVATEQARRARQAQLEADRAISNNQRELEQTRAENAALVAQAEAKRQDALAIQRTAELRATQIAQATADAERIKIDAIAQAEADAIHIKRVAEANAESIREVNKAIAEGGEAYFRYRQIEMIPQIAPSIAQALAQSKLITITGGNDGKGAPESTSNNISSVIQTVLAAQLVSRNNLLDGSPNVPASNGTNGAPDKA